MMDLCRIDAGRCKGCDLCVAFCPKDALALSEGRNAAGYHPAVLAHPDRCNGCALCAEMCPETAIEIYRRKKSSAGQPTTDQG
jgi:2-oxoglutarate ferredoxin oxidoreductase subunit delta